MNLLVINRTAFRTLGRHKMRSILTTLGIAVGVAAVVSTVAIGEGAASRIHTAIENYGANVIWVEAGSVTRGGVLGTALGFVSSRVLVNVMEWPVHVSTNAVLVAVVFSAVIGMFFGSYPARQVEGLDPIEALRYEG